MNLVIPLFDPYILIPLFDPYIYCPEAKKNEKIVGPCRALLSRRATPNRRHLWSDPRRVLPLVIWIRSVRSGKP